MAGEMDENHNGRESAVNMNQSNEQRALYV